MHGYFLPLCVNVAEYLKVTLGCWSYSVKMPPGQRRARLRQRNTAMTSYLAGEEATHTDDAEDVEDG